MNEFVLLPRQALEIIDCGIAPVPVLVVDVERPSEFIARDRAIVPDPYFSAALACGFSGCVLCGVSHKRFLTYGEHEAKPHG